MLSCDNNTVKNRKEVRKVKKRPSVLRRNICIVVMSVLTALATLLIPVHVEAAEQMERLSFGFPFAFVRQNSTLTPLYYPLSVSVGSPWENPTSFMLPKFLLCVGVYCVIYAAVYFAAMILKKRAK